MLLVRIRLSPDGRQRTSLFLTPIAISSMKTLCQTVVKGLCYTGPMETTSAEILY